ncbi:ankyrin domain protein [Colletotrichum sojae]|uniref:Ankyrin domain protein n=1 Tax=Colletotrichum sojae TaxID=2175907 RepID=A0A8H6MHT1_9PEZI|nr:ankyrin domain protein [Colletotrichum sojae]
MPAKGAYAPTWAEDGQQVLDVIRQVDGHLQAACTCERSAPSLKSVHADQARQRPPFTQKLLENDIAQGTEESQCLESNFTSLLPASRRTKDDDLLAPALSAILNPAGVADMHHTTDILDWVGEEVDLDRLADIHEWFWIVGRPMPPRPLHQQRLQRLLNREIMVTEKMDMHLVWTTNRIFIKPLPRFLLSRRFWARFLCWHEVPVSNADSCSCGGRRERALGFLFSRLNKIYFFWTTLLRGYMSRWNQSGSFQDNFTWLASSTVYVAVVLTAMQVGLATEVLQNNEAFQSASYGFTVFSILGPLAAARLIMVVFCYMFIDNLIATRRYARERATMMLEGVAGRSPNR